MTEQKVHQKMNIQGMDEIYFLGSNLDGLKAAYLLNLLITVILFAMYGSLAITPVTTESTAATKGFSYIFNFFLVIWVISQFIRISISALKIFRNWHRNEMLLFACIMIAIAAVTGLQFLLDTSISVLTGLKFFLETIHPWLKYLEMMASLVAWLVLYHFIMNQLTEYKIKSPKPMFFLIIMIASVISVITIIFTVTGFDGIITNSTNVIVYLSPACIILGMVKSRLHNYYYGYTAALDREKRNDDILVIKDLQTFYPIRGGFMLATVGYVKAVNGVSITIRRGETLSLVGESGCGKSTLGKTILGLVPKHDGEIIFNDIPIPKTFPPYLRKKMQFIFQDPDASLNPRMTIFQTIAEPLKNLNPEFKKSQIKNRVLELMGLVSLNYEHLYRYPHEFSGGQKQRIVIARALACGPEFLVLDEPTSSLDVSVQAQILNLLKELQIKLGLSYLFITHDLSVVNHIASRVAVMYLGRLVEIGPVDRIFNNPAHPYTRALLAARSIPDPEKSQHRIILKGEVPSIINPPSGCPFNPRCYYQKKGQACTVEVPRPVVVETDHVIWTSLFESDGCWMHEQEISS